MDRSKSIDLLNQAVGDELQAVHQYMYFHFHLDDQGFGPLALLYKRTAIEEINGVPVVKASCLFRVSGAPISSALYVWLHRLEPDIAHLHFPNPPGELGQLFFGRSRRFVITYHSDVVRQKNLLRVYKPFLWQVWPGAQF